MKDTTGLKKGHVYRYTDGCDSWLEVGYALVLDNQLRNGVLPVAFDIRKQVDGTLVVSIADEKVLEPRSVATYGLINGIGQFAGTPVFSTTDFSEPISTEKITFIEDILRRVGYGLREGKLVKLD